MSLVGALVFFVRGPALLGVMFLGAAVAFAYGYWRYGTVWLASRALRAGDRARASALLAQVRTPSALNSPQRGSYELTAGALAIEKENWGEAEWHLRESLRHKLSENNRALAELWLAQAAVVRGDGDGAEALLETALSRECKPVVRKLIEDFQALLLAPPAEQADRAERGEVD